MANKNRTALSIEILVVEDNPGDLRLFLEEFKEIEMAANFHVETNGLDALEFLLKQGEYTDAPTPDLLVLDLNLPKKSGLEVLSEMNQNKNLNRIPVVVYSASPDQEDLIRNYKNIDWIFITKPGTLEEYADVVKSVEKFWLSIGKRRLINFHR